MAADHHVQDVGKILLQAQSDLKKIRESLGGDGHSPEGQLTAGNLQHVVEKVETELRLKAEAVLKIVAQGTVSSLPSLGTYNFRSGSGPSVQPLHEERRNHTQTPAMLSKQVCSPSSTAPLNGQNVAHHKSAMRPSHHYNTGKNGVQQLQPSGRPMGRHVTQGKLRRERNATSLGAPSAAVRGDPHAVPPIGLKDAASGLFSLVNRRLIPPNVDLTPALERYPAPMKQAPSRMHAHSEQFAPHHRSSYISPFGFNASNTKLDVLTGASC